ncbi:hypothetical protein ACLOJK_009997 [Asimina triloba]
MEKTAPFHPQSSFSQIPLTHRTARPISSTSQRLAAGGVSMEKPPPFLRLSSDVGVADFNDPKKLKSLNSAKQMHAQMVKSAFSWNLDSTTTSSLVRMYAEMGDFLSAATVLFMGFRRDSLSWGTLMEEFEKNGREWHVLLAVFRELHKEGLIFHGRILTALLRICAKLMDSCLGEGIHACGIKSGFDSDVHLKCALTEMYDKCFGFEYASKLFDEIHVRNSLVWEQAIKLNSRNGLWLESLELFRQMQLSLAEAGGLTISKVLQACGKLEALEQGKQIHGYTFRTGWISDPLICKCLISMYCKNSDLRLARRVFDSMDSRCSVAWNSMISGYALNGFIKEAWQLFNAMELSETKPNIITWNSLLTGHSAFGSHIEVLEILRRMQASGLWPNATSVTCALQAVSQSGPLLSGKEIHGYAVRNGLENDIYVGTSLVDMYAKKLRLSDAEAVTHSMKFRNVFAWNSLISGYAYNGFFDKALELLNMMEKNGVEPDLTTWNVLIFGYALRGFSKKALVLIHQLKTLGLTPSMVSWTALISGCSQAGNYTESLDFFLQMQEEGIKPTLPTLASLLQACAGLAMIQKGAELHCYAMRNGFDGDIFIATALVDMYSKSGGLKYASRVFEGIQNKNIASWNAVIMGFAIHGLGREAISLFDCMCDSGICPDSITFTALLSGCRHAGLIAEGWKYFDNMRTEYGINPTLEHYACMVDLLGRGGYLDEAWDFLRNMPIEPDAGAWGALLGACKIHKNLELAEIAAEKLFQLEPDNSGNYVLMMSLYAAKNRWEDVENLRDVMNVVGAKNRPGWSWVWIDQTVHVFLVEGTPHPEMGEIFFELYQLMEEIRKVGYVPDTSCVDQDIDEEQKEKALLSHTEKLAITYGLINTEEDTAIRVLSMCMAWQAIGERLPIKLGRRKMKTAKYRSREDEGKRKGKYSNVETALATTGNPAFTTRSFPYSEAEST